MTSDFGEYFRNKILKLQKQNAFEVNENESDIFSGCYFLINGITDPPIEELRRLLRINGGICESYPVPRVTHTICNHFTEAQIKQHSSRKQLIGDKSKMLYVKVNWVLDSIKNNKRLDEADYTTEGLNQGKSLRIFFAGTANERFAQTNSLSSAPVSIALAAASPTNKDTLQPHTDILPAQCSISPTVAKTSSPIRTMPKYPLNKQIGSSNGAPVHTSEHPDFLQQYFRQSRLSFIGRWRNRVPTLAKKYGQGDLNFSSVFSILPATSPHGHGSSNSNSRVVIHVDMDCFFVSALIRHRPELKDTPVAVAHSSNAGSSEISSCNYPARFKGLKNGMFMDTARKLCPELVVLPYDFILYDDLTEKIYSVLYTSSALMVEPVSCDEAYLEYPEGTDAQLVAAKIRSRIEEVTGGCTASAGIGCNMLLARLATKKAKPNGQFQVSMSGDDHQSAKFMNYDSAEIDHVNLNLSQIDDEPAHSRQTSNHDSAINSSGSFVRELLQDLPVSELPGIGWKTSPKIHEKNIMTCRDIWKHSKVTLQNWFGNSIGKLLWEFSHGIDDRPLTAVQPVKSIGAEVNWGVRFSERDQAEDFLKQISTEVSNRLEHAERKAKCVTVKLMVKSSGAAEPAKFMGHGICDSISKSQTLHRCIWKPNDVSEVAITLFRHLTLAMEMTALRGMGISMSKLEDFNTKSIESQSSKLHQSNIRLYVNTNISSINSYNEKIDSNGESDEDVVIEQNDALYRTNEKEANEVDQGVSDMILDFKMPSEIPEENTLQLGTYSSMAQQAASNSFCGRKASNSNETNPIILIDDDDIRDENTNLTDNHYENAQPSRVALSKVSKHTSRKRKNSLHSSMTEKAKSKKSYAITCTTKQVVSKGHQMSISLGLQLQGIDDQTRADVPRSVLVDHFIQQQSDNSIRYQDLASTSTEQSRMARREANRNGNGNLTEYYHASNEESNSLMSYNSRSDASRSHSRQGFSKASTQPGPQSNYASGDSGDSNITYAFQKEPITVIAAGLKSWLREISGLNKVNILLPAAKCSSLDILFSEPTSDDETYLSSYGVWLVHTTQLDIAAAFIRILHRLSKSIASEIKARLDGTNLPSIQIKPQFETYRDRLDGESQFHSNSRLPSLFSQVQFLLQSQEIDEKTCSSRQYHNSDDTGETYATNNHRIIKNWSTLGNRVEESIQDQMKVVLGASLCTGRSLLLHPN